MSLGNVSSFLDIYIEYDMAHGLLDEAHAQELIDQFCYQTAYGTPLAYAGLYRHLCRRPDMG